MDGLDILSQVIPEHGTVITCIQEILRVALLGVDEMWELQSVTDKEDWGVVEDPVVVTPFCVELHGNTSWVSDGLGGADLTANGRETDDTRTSVADLLVGRGVCDVGKRFCQLELETAPSASGVHYTVGGPLAVKVGQVLYQMCVLQQDRPVLAGDLRPVWVALVGEPVGSAVDALGSSWGGFRGHTAVW